MENKEVNKHLVEEKYQKAKKKLIKTSILIFLVGLLIGGGLITSGLIKRSEIASRFSEENKLKVSQQLEDEREKLENKKKELEDKIAPIKQQIKDLERTAFDGFNEAYYERKNKIDELVESKREDEETLDLLENALDGGRCGDDEKENKITSEYCSIKEEYYYINEDWRESYIDCAPFFIFGIFIVVAFGMISLFIYLNAKGRDIAAFTMQETLPLAQEGLEKITPTMKNVTKEMASAYGDIAREVAKGVEKGKRQGKLDRCSGCGAAIDDEASECKYCGNKY